MACMVIHQESVPGLGSRPGLALHRPISKLFWFLSTAIGKSLLVTERAAYKSECWTCHERVSHSYPMVSRWGESEHDKGCVEVQSVALIEWG